MMFKLKRFRLKKMEKLTCRCLQLIAKKYIEFIIGIVLAPEFPCIGEGSRYCSRSFVAYKSILAIVSCPGKLNENGVFLPRTSPLAALPAPEPPSVLPSALQRDEEGKRRKIDVEHKAPDVTNVYWRASIIYVDFQIKPGAKAARKHRQTISSSFRSRELSENEKK